MNTDPVQVSLGKAAACDELNAFMLSMCKKHGADNSFDAMALVLGTWCRQTKDPSGSIARAIGNLKWMARRPSLKEFLK